MWTMDAGQWTEELRARHRLSQAQLAYRAGTSQQAISRVERGVVSPSVAFLERLAVVCGEDVRLKKPDPEVYRHALRLLGESPLRTLAIEDSPGGVAAAREAGIPVLVTHSACFRDATIEDAIAIGPGLHDRRGWRPALTSLPGQRLRVGLDDIEAWYETMEAVSQYA